MTIDVVSLIFGILLGILGSWVYINFMFNTSIDMKDVFDDDEDDK